MSSVIRVENLGKRYLLSHQSERQPYLALRDVIADGVRNLGRRLIGHQEGAPRKEEFWALRDVSFEVNQGDRVGIIGRNGAGKSTLLKILSRITEPTTGRVTIRGRVASLLEVGTGFHPELTGRENIFLNGAILGMSRAEIKRKFDEIVDFAEIEKFLDTPVKRYSSGMYVRLAFAVAAHLEPEILVVDEVLAVGDAQFQRKCLGKMEDVSRGGRTILFVSHNMGAVRQLCNSAMVISTGMIDSSGDVESSIEQYLSSFRVVSLYDSLPSANNNEFGISLVETAVLNERGEPVVAAEIGTETQLEFVLRSDRPYSNCLLAVTIDSADDVRVCALHSAVSGAEVRLLPPGNRVRCVIPKMGLMPGHYRLTFKLRIADATVLYLPKSFDLEVIAGDFYGTSKLPEREWGGVCLMEHSWKTLPCG